MVFMFHEVPVTSGQGITGHRTGKYSAVGGRWTIRQKSSGKYQILLGLFDAPLLLVVPPIVLRYSYQENADAVAIRSTGIAEEGASEDNVSIRYKTSPWMHVI